MLGGGVKATSRSLVAELQARKLSLQSRISKKYENGEDIILEEVQDELDLEAESGTEAEKAVALSKCVNILANNIGCTPIAGVIQCSIGGH